MADKSRITLCSVLLIWKMIAKMYFAFYNILLLISFCQGNSISDRILERLAALEQKGLSILIYLFPSFILKYHNNTITQSYMLILKSQFYDRGHLFRQIKRRCSYSRFFTCPLTKQPYLSIFRLGTHRCGRKASSSTPGQRQNYRTAVSMQGLFI